MLIIMTHKKSTLLVYNLYELQFMNLDIFYKCLECSQGTEYFQKKENSNNIKRVKCYSCNIKEHYTQDYYR